MIEGDVLIEQYVDRKTGVMTTRWYRLRGKRKRELLLQYVDPPGHMTQVTNVSIRGTVVYRVRKHRWARRRPK